MNVQIRTSPTINITDLPLSIAAKLEAVLHGVDDNDMSRLRGSIEHALAQHDFGLVYELDERSRTIRRQRGDSDGA